LPSTGVILIFAHGDHAGFCSAMTTPSSPHGTSANPPPSRLRPWLLRLVLPIGVPLVFFAVQLRPS
jgi:hypothetical protein